MKQKINTATANRGHRTCQFTGHGETVPVISGVRPKGKLKHASKRDKTPRHH